MYTYIYIYNTDWEITIVSLPSTKVLDPGVHSDSPQTTSANYRVSSIINTV